MRVPDELAELRASRRRRQDRVADAMTAFSGSMTFVYLHVTWFAAWLIVNSIPGLEFDPFPFGLLTLIVSLEAIFLSTFVLISQNRQSERSDIRARSDFETNVQSEVWTELMAEKLGVDREEVKRRVKRRLAEADRKADRAAS